MYPEAIWPNYTYALAPWIPAQIFAQWPFYLRRSREDVAPSAEVSAEAAVRSGSTAKGIQREIPGSLLPMHDDFPGLSSQAQTSDSLGGPFPLLPCDDVRG